MQSKNFIDVLLSRVFETEAARFPLTVSFIGGTFINIISQADALFFGAEFSLLKAIITYMVFYLLGLYLEVQRE